MWYFDVLRMIACIVCYFPGHRICIVFDVFTGVESLLLLGHTYINILFTNGSSGRQFVPKVCYQKRFSLKK